MVDSAGHEKHLENSPKMSWLHSDSGAYQVNEGKTGIHGGIQRVSISTL